MNLKIILSWAICVLFLLSCDSCPPWAPILEETSFRYLDTAVDQAIEAISSAKESVRTNKKQDGLASLAKAEHICLNLKKYYLPLTNVRHLIYDADRYVYLKKTGEARKRLEESRVIVEKIDLDFNEPSMEQSTEELIAMIEDCLLSLNGEKKTVMDKFGNLGHHVNMMLIKGELVLSGDRS